MKPNFRRSESEWLRHLHSQGSVTAELEEASLAWLRLFSPAEAAAPARFTEAVLPRAWVQLAVQLAVPLGVQLAVQLAVQLQLAF